MRETGVLRKEDKQRTEWTALVIGVIICIMVAVLFSYLGMKYGKAKAMIETEKSVEKSIKTEERIEQSIYIFMDTGTSETIAIRSDLQPEKVKALIAFIYPQRAELILINKIEVQEMGKTRKNNLPENEFRKQKKSASPKMKPFSKGEDRI